MGRVERAVVEALVRAVDSGASFVAEADLAAVARAAGGGGRAGRGSRYAPVWSADVPFAGGAPP
jgi:hypothetical protein